MRTAFLIVLKKLEKGTPNVKFSHWCGILPLAHVGQTKRKIYGRVTVRALMLVPK